MDIREKLFTAIIAEYNPLHNGHVYHIKKTTESIKPDINIIIMSGSFTQRGTQSILDKYTRASHAIKAGADIVIELPTVFALSNAEYFAKGAVKILSAIGGKGYLSFGSECGDVNSLTKLAKIILNEPDEVSADIKINLQNMPFPIAREKAFIDYAAKHNIDIPDMKSPNNMLALEYIKAILEYNSSLTPFTIKRKGAGYHDTIIDEYISSKFARNAINSNNIDLVKGKLPEYVIEDIKGLTVKENTAVILNKLQSMNTEEIRKLYDVKEGLENRLKKYADSSVNFDEFIKNIQTKRYTSSRLQRIIMYALLDITNSLHDYAKQSAPYFNVLAVKKSKTDYLSELALCGEIYTTNKQLASSSNPLANLDAEAFRIRQILTEQKGANNMLVVE